MSGGTDPFDPSDPAADSLWARGGDDTFSWHFTPAQTGTYEVWEWHSGWTSRTSAAPHQITHAGGTTNVAVNQKNDAGKWNSLGVYQFTAGQHYRVTVTSVADNSSTCADAVKFTHIGTGNLPPVATIDVITKTAILPGDEISFMGSGSDEGSVEAYEWRSDIDGLLSNQDVFRTTSLSPGTHTIFFRVRDEQNAWSNPATALVVVQDCSSPVAIMPIGDSITMGYGQISDPDLMTGYRAILHQQLVSRGYNIDFVGNRAEGRLVLPPFDINHQGIGGISAAFIASNVYNWLVENPAEIVLLHIGTNAFTTSPLGVEAILNAIDQYEVENSRDVIVILAQIINRKPYHPDTTLFNDNLQAMAEARIVGGDKIVIVDQESALNYSTDMWDKLHPNNLGYAKMPAPWIDELIGLLPTCSVFEPAIFTTPSEQATVGAEYTYQAAALGNPAPTYSLFSAPTGMTIDSITGAISWVPAAGDEGVHTITVRANSAAGVFDQSFKLNVGTVAVTITRDNYDPDTSSTGDWLVSGGTDPFEPGDPAADSLWARGGDDTFSWYFTAAQTGMYEVWEWHSGWSSRTNAAPHQITHAGGSTNVVVNQKINAGRWNSLGVYQFTAGQRYRVTVTSVADNSSTCADAVRWTLVTSGNNPPTAKIDSISPSPANQGEDVVFTGSGTDTDGSIAAYQWSSDIGGILSSSKSFSTSGLAAGTHTITFQVRDDDGAWSLPATQILGVGNTSFTPVYPGGNWQTATPESQGVYSAFLNSAIDYFNNNSNGSGSAEMVIVRNGYVIWQGSSVDAFHTLYSGTKPFTTTVMGLLIQQGVISSINDPVVDYFPSLDDQYATYAGITFKHLASFTSGYNADNTAVADMQFGDPRKFLTSLSPLAPPGTKFQYFDPAIHQLGNILTFAAGDTLENIFKTGIADVIGMTNWEWQHHGYYDNGQSPEIVANFLNPSGVYGGGIHITPMDVARFGLLYLNRGIWNGQQVLSSEYVDEATTNQVPITLNTASFDQRGKFGYMWYTNDFGADGTRPWPSAPPKTYTFKGMGGNYCFVIPEWKMVVSRMSLPNQGSMNDQIWDGFFSRLKAGISDSPLPYQ